MTMQQISTLTTMRHSGAGYLRIAQVLGVSKDTVKKYCQRHGMTKETGAMPKEEFCSICGSKLIPIAGKKAKRFCSDRCRYTWHNSNRRQGAGNAAV